MSKKNVWWHYIVVFVLVLSIFFVPLVMKADSGWDYDYDSGGYDSDWGSDWDSDYDYDYDYGYDGGYYGGGDTTFSVIFFLFVMIGIIILSIIGRRGEKNKRRYSAGYSSNSIVNYVDISNDALHEVDKAIDIETFKTTVFNKYKDLQIAWMNFDYDSIKKLTTDEMYNMYHSQLETLKLKHRQNIMSGIEYLDAKVIKATIDGNVKKIEVYLKVECYDYVIDGGDKVVRGDDRHKVIIDYVLILVKASDNDKKVEKCPNCGAKVDVVSSGTCPYCDSVLVKLAGDYVISKKTCVGQRRK